MANMRPSLDKQHNPSIQVARFILAKFSYATASASHDTPFNWNHLLGKGDLIAVFEKCLTVPPEPHFHEKLLLRVSHHQGVLEEIDLRSLAREAAHQNLSRQTSNPRHSVAVIVKLPCLAIRYPNGIEQIRRFQIKFSSDRDYYTALAMLSEINCPFTESNPGPPSRSTHLSGGLGSSSVRNVIFRSQSALENSLAEKPPIRGASISSSSSRTIYGSAENIGLRNEPSSQDNSGCSAPSQRNALLGTRITNRESSLSHQRPFTAPGFHDTQALNLALPPKRELPFPRDTMKGSQTNNNKTVSHDILGDSRTGLETRGLVGSQGTPISRANTRLNDFTDPADTALSRPSDTVLVPNSEAPRNTALHYAYSTAHQIAETGFSHQINLPPSIVSVSDPQTDVMPASAEPIQTLIASAVNAYRTEVQRPSETGDAAANASLSPRTDAITSTDLTSYSIAQDSERSVLLESWICQQLENDGFLRLCEDLEGVWKRIAFGK